MDQARIHPVSIAALVLAAARCGGATAEAGAGGPTYHRDVAPILATSCGGCHREGGISSFSLQTYAEARAHAGAIASSTAARTMPPWPPAAGCAEYVEDRSLSAEAIATLGAWARAGAPEGDPRSAPEKQDPPADKLSRVDRTLSIPEPFTPTLAPDQYRCFLVDWPETTTRYITGMGVEPGAGAIVHHVIAFHAKPDEVDDYQALDDAEPGPGYDCFGSPRPDGQAAGWVGGWVPGGEGTDFPAGSGIEIEPGSKLVVQVHYNTSSAEAEPDRTTLLLRLDDSVDRKATVLPFTNPSWVMAHTMDIPAHGKDVTHAFTADPTPFMNLITGGVLTAGEPFTIHDVGLHLHTRGTSGRVGVERSGGGEACMLDIERWNFHWQGSYRLARPIDFHPGDKLSLECHWDNPSATDLNWGEGTGDEMCLSILYVTR